ncbi:MAG: alanine dehydrogenase [Flavobacteriales bacterium]
MSDGFFTPFGKHELIPQEEVLEILHKKENLKIGIPKETQFQEERVCLTPDAVSVLVANGHHIMVESGAGDSTHFSDNEYSEAGAQIAYDTQEVFSQHIVLKVAPPSLEEIEYMKPKSYLISALQLSIQNKAYFELLMSKKITSLSFDDITDESNNHPIVKILSEIAGTSSILIASELMSTTNQGPGLIMGGIAGVRPTEIVILGAGTVGQYATKAAIGLGASVKVFDSSVSKLRNLQNHIGQRVFTSIVEPKELGKAVMRCDVLIGAVRGSGRTPTIVTEEMVKNMKTGAVIVDVSIDLGGCIETGEITTHNHPTFEKHGVIHYGVTNISSRVSRTATKALSNFFLQNLTEMADYGGIETYIKRDKGFRNGIYIYKGILTKKIIGDWFGLPFNDINLLIF